MKVCCIIWVRVLFWWLSKEYACNMGALHLIPRLGRSPGGGHGNPLQHSCLENLHGQRIPVAYIQSIGSQRVEYDSATKHSTQHIPQPPFFPPARKMWYVSLILIFSLMHLRHFYSKLSLYCPYSFPFYSENFLFGAFLLLPYFWLNSICIPLDVLGDMI